MSLDLGVIFDCPLATMRFVVATEQTLKELLPAMVEDTRQIRIDCWGKPLPLLACDLIMDAGWSGLLYCDETHKVELTVLRMADVIRQFSITDPLEPSDFDLTASFAVRGSGGNPLSYVFAAICAAGLARETGSRITLDSIGWPGPHEQEPAEFLANIKTSEEFRRAIESLKVHL